MHLSLDLMHLGLYNCQFKHILCSFIMLSDSLENRLLYCWNNRNRSKSQILETGCLVIFLFNCVMTEYFKDPLIIEINMFYWLGEITIDVNCAWNIIPKSKVKIFTFATLLLCLMSNRQIFWNAENGIEYESFPNILNIQILSPEYGQILRNGRMWHIRYLQVDRKNLAHISWMRSKQEFRTTLR